MAEPRINLDDSKQRMRRVDLVQRSLRRRGIRDQRVIEAMSVVPRHLFLTAEYDAIVVGAGAPQVPTALVDQLGEAGTLVIPVGDRHEQQLTRVRKRGEQVTREALCACSFVPLVGRYGWSET